MYPFAIINSFGSKIERVYRQFAAKVNKEIFPMLRRERSRPFPTGIINDAANVQELLEEIRLTYGDYVDDALLTKIIAENIELLDGWSTSQLNRMIENQNVAMGVGVIGKDGSRPVLTVPLIPKKNVVSMQNIPLANNSQRLLQNDAYSKYFFDVEEIINKGIIDGLNADEITKQILDKVDMNAKRARFWAEDQASIFQAEQTRLKAQREGYTHYRWKTQGNARPSHAVHKDQIYSWNVGVNNLTRPGARHPGEDYRCHCEPALVTPEEIAKAGVGNPGPRTPQSTAGLIENYSGSEAVKAEKGKLAQLQPSAITLKEIAGNALNTIGIPNSILKKYDTSTTVVAATEYATTQLGIDANYGTNENLTIANTINMLLTEIKNKTYGSLPNVSIAELESGVFAKYDPQLDKIFFNQNSGYWKNPKAFMKNQKGLTSTSSIMHPFWHEYAHYAVKVKSPSRYKVLQNLFFDDTQKLMIESKLGEYAAKDGLEFVAEVYARKKAGLTIDKAILKLYKEVGGNIL